MVQHAWERIFGRFQIDFPSCFTQFYKCNLSLFSSKIFGIIQETKERHGLHKSTRFK